MSKPTPSKGNDIDYSKIGDQCISQMDKVNSELFAMMYGSLVVQLLRDYKDVNVVNAELFKIGYNMGLRMIEEFLVRANLPPCSSFKETVTALAETAFKIFLGIKAEVKSADPPNERKYSLVFTRNPLNEFVELPPSCSSLQYSMIICGAITGALRSIHLVVDCEVVQDELKGSTQNEISITLKEILKEQYQDEDE